MFFLSAFVIFNPLEQFELFSWCPRCGGGGFLAVFALFLFGLLTLFAWGVGHFFRNNYLYFLYRSIIDFVRLVLLENVALRVYGFFPIIFFLFVFILVSNMLGIVPLFFTITSLASLTFFLSLTFFIGINLVGLELHRADYICLFVPTGVPGALLPLLITIEFISYLVRPVSLAMRLCANMLAGHVLIKIIGSYVVKVLTGPFTFYLAIPIIAGLLLVITALEFVIAFLQAYVFLVLMCIYLNDVVNLH